MCKNSISKILYTQLNEAATNRYQKWCFYLGCSLSPVRKIATRLFFLSFEFVSLYISLYLSRLGLYCSLISILDLLQWLQSALARSLDGTAPAPPRVMCM